MRAKRASAAAAMFHVGIPPLGDGTIFARPLLASVTPPGAYLAWPHMRLICPMLQPDRRAASSRSIQSSSPDGPRGCAATGDVCGAALIRPPQKRDSAAV